MLQSTDTQNVLCITIIYMSCSIAVYFSIKYISTNSTVLK